MCNERDNANVYTCAQKSKACREGWLSSMNVGRHELELATEKRSIIVRESTRDAGHNERRG